MINENLEQSINLLENDALFIKNIKGIISSTYNQQETSDAELKANVKKAQSLILHILDYYVTLGMIDMDADLLRLCNDNPQLAKRLSRTLNDVGITLKQNYQYLCKEGTLYNEGLPLFKVYYSLALQAAINDTVVLSRVPDYVLEFKDIEFISTIDNATRKKKLELLNNTEFTLSSVQSFISNCLSWSDTIEDYLMRSRQYRTIIDVDDNILQSIFDYCSHNVKIFSQSVSLISFVDAIKNIKPPIFQITQKDYFYALILAIYDSLGDLFPRNKWKDEVLKSFDLDLNNYRNAKSRIISGKAPKLESFYNEIRTIIQSGK